MASMTASSMGEYDTIVVGAGIAGLVCAVELERAGQRVLLVEQAGAVGGRVRSTVIDGYTIDHGFQVLFTAYPVLRRYLDLERLALRTFLPAARIAHDGGSSLIGDAWKNPALLVDTIAARTIPVADKLRLLALRRLATSLTVDECFAARFSALSAAELLRERGLSAAVIDRFFAPFYGGIFLDRTLASSASLLLFTFKMLAEGDSAVPAAGIGALSAQIAALLRPGTVALSCAVERVEASGGRVRGVRLAGGELLRARNVILAADAPAVEQLAASAGASYELPRGALGCATVYWTADEPPLRGRALWLNADPRPVASHAVTLTEIAPEYAPTGRHLVAATAVGDAARLDDAALVRGAERDLAAMRGAALPPLRHLATWRVPYAQYPQPPHFREHRPSIAALGASGLWLASELLHSSSLEGAARGGRDAARAVVAAERARPAA
jgi:phytoene dehydrogenase-like protein